MYLFSCRLVQYFPSYNIHYIYIAPEQSWSAIFHYILENSLFSHFTNFLNVVMLKNVFKHKIKDTCICINFHNIWEILFFCSICANIISNIVSSFPSQRNTAMVFMQPHFTIMTTCSIK